MEFLKQWTLCVCITLIVAVILSLFTPKGKMQAFYKVILSLFIFISFLYPFKEMDLSEPHADSFFSEDTQCEESVLIPYRDSVNYTVKAFLVDNSIIGADVTSTVSLTEDGQGVSVDEVVVAIPEEYSKKAVQELVLNGIGIKARVIYIGE